ncbi:MAG TPA: hypothetical protein VFH58_08015 [Acidimicrobiales bacterium]|nr:hypothetical protein [Acidimicrobiales bacterium]
MREDLSPRQPSKYPPVNLFLLGSAYCGSTHLGGLIAANFDAVYAGETARLPAFVESLRLYDHPASCYLCGTRGHLECPVWTEEAVHAVQAAGPVAGTAELRRRTGAPVIVDGSKFPEWLRRSSAGEPADQASVAAVLLVRSPFEYVVSATSATGQPTWVTAQWWRDVYVDGLRTVARASIPFAIIRNEDIRSHPGRALRSIGALVNQPVPDQLRPAEPTHSLGGNLWVQLGYSRDTLSYFSALGVPHDERAHTDAEWAEVAAQKSTTAANRPSDVESALAMMQSVVDTPGLHDLAELLGYQLVREMHTFAEGAGR